MKRRQFLQTSVAGGVLAFPGTALLTARSIYATPPEGLQRLFGNVDQIRQLGDAYLSANPDERDVGVLQDLTVPADDSQRAADAICTDFAGGAVVQLDGWILSRTEARHCALYSLLTSEIG